MNAKINMLSEKKNQTEESALDLHKILETANPSLKTKADWWFCEDKEKEREGGRY